MKKGDLVLDKDGEVRIITSRISFNRVYLDGDLSKTPAIPTLIDTITPITKEVADIIWSVKNVDNS
jgi:hypothetical protein